MLDCGHPPTKDKTIGLGYGTDKHNKKHCYTCCATQDKEAMLKDGRITLYLTDKAVTNWPGTMSFPITRQKTGRHNIARVRYDVWFRGPDGYMWHGVQYGDNTQLCHCKRTKER
jgi:hypothetical protein